MTPTMERTFTGTWDPVGGDQPVVEEPVGVVPQALGVDGLADGREVLDELEHQIETGPLAAAVQDGRHGGHGQGVRGHPARGVGLLQRAADRKMRAVDRPDVVQPQEAALEEVVALLVFEVDPPGEVDEELVEHPAQKIDVTTAVDGEDLKSGPGLHGRIDVPEIPLVGGQGPVGMLEPFPAQKDQLVLGERRVHVGQGDAVKGQVPRGEPRVLPLVRHRHDVEGIEVAPPRIAARQSRGGWWRLGGVSRQPT